MMVNLKKILIYNKEFFFRIFFFTILFFLSILLFEDYGASMDEDQYRDNGYIDYLFIKGFLLNFRELNISSYYNDYLNNAGKYSSFFYIIVYLVKDIIESLFTLQLEVRTVSYLFLKFFFIISNYFFFKIILIRFKNLFFSYLGVIILFTTPRIFAESFYNNRDIFFLSLTLLNLYFFQKLILKFNFKNIIYYSIIIGISINVRIFGFFFFILTFFLIILEYEKKAPLKELFFKLFIFIFISFTSFLISSPYLWFDFLQNFVKFYFYDLSMTSGIRVSNLFLGKFYSSQFSPYYYYLIWIMFTVPISYLIIIFFGLISKSIFFAKRIYELKKNNNIWLNKIELTDFYIFFSLIFITFIMSRFVSIKYDGWRHLYFLYPFMIINLFYILEFLNNKKKLIMNLSLALIIVTITFNLKWIFFNHPYQYVYFNVLNSIFFEKKFDLDYWGVSNYQLYKFILKNSEDQLITIGTISFNDLEDSLSILNIDEKKRLEIISKDEEPQFLIDNYRVGYKRLKFSEEVKNKLLKNYDLVMQIKVDNNIINSLYKKK